MAKSNAFSTSNQYIKYTIEVIQNSQNVANNASNVTVKVRFYRTNTGYETYGSGTVYCKINGTTYSASVTSSQKITNSGIVLFTKTLNIAHNTDGTKTLTCSAWIDHSRVTSSEQSYSQTLTTIPRKSTLTVANGTLGTAQTLTVTRQSTSFTHTITYTCGTASGTICTKSTATSISFTPPLTLARQNTTGANVSVTYKIETFNGSTSVGSNTYTKSCAIPESVKPTIVGVTWEETKGSPFGIIRGVSKLKMTVVTTPAYDSAIKSCYTTIEGKVYTGSEFETDVIKGVGNVSFKTVVTDNRDRTSEYNAAVYVEGYAQPQITSFSVVRCNADGTANKSGDHAKIVFDYEFYPLSGGNSLSIKTQYKAKSASNYTDIATDEHGATDIHGTTTKIFAAATSTAYEVQVVATDTVCETYNRTSTTEHANLGTINKFLSFFKQIGLGVGKVFDTTKPYSLQIGWDIYDKYDTQIRNGVAAYEGAGIDANTTLEHHVLTQTNTPSNTFHHVITYFYNDKTVTSNRVQMAIPYKTPTVTFHRYYLNGVWSEWMNDGLAAYPVGSYYMSHNDTSPAELFGGTWQRIEGRFVYGCASSGTIGATGSHTTGSGSSTLPYVNVALWRRTA